MKPSEDGFDASWGPQQNISTDTRSGLFICRHGALVITQWLGLTPKDFVGINGVSNDGW
jgi:hypothetical protein